MAGGLLVVGGVVVENDDDDDERSSIQQMRDGKKSIHRRNHECVGKRNFLFLIFQLEMTVE